MTKSKKKKTGFFNKLILFFNLISALFLIFSYISQNISPEKFWLFAFFGLAYPVFILINFLFILYWVLLKRWFLFISLVAIIFGWNIHGRFFKMFNEKTIDMPGEISILTYNVHHLDIYHNKKWMSDRTNRNAIFTYLKEQNSDIICLQEFILTHSTRFRTLDTLLKLIDMKYHYFDYGKVAKKDIFFGNIILSKYPIVNKGKVEYPGKTFNICVFVDILIKNKIYRVYNIHFQSNRLKPEDYAFAENLKELDNIKNEGYLKRGSRNIISRLKRAYIKRAAQVDIVNKHIAKCTYPVIVCGDFNDTPLSYSYKSIIKSKKLKDSYIEAGNGFSQTYAGTAFPSFRIDYILHSTVFKTLNYSRDKIYFSDHYPVRVEILPK